MIDERKLIKSVKAYKELGLGKNLHSIADAIIEIIESQLKVGEWIPFNKEEPKEEGLYLCCFDDRFITTVEYEDGDWILWADSGEVVAWQPLPEPYEVKENERI